VLVERSTSEVRLVPVPKPGGIRWLTRLGSARATSYTRAVLPVVGPIELALSPSAVANRVVHVSHDPPAIRLEGWREAHARLRRLAAALAARSGAVLLADVRSCYGSIGVDEVRGALERVGCPPGHIGAVVEVIEGFGDEGVPGLPVGPEPSAVLANAVLAHVDERLRAVGHRHLRWVDDLMVFGHARGSVTAALPVLEGALADLRLGLAHEKTRVVEDPTWLRSGRVASCSMPLANPARG
jgi:hypothetical protein